MHFTKVQISELMRKHAERERKWSARPDGNHD